MVSYNLSLKYKLSNKKIPNLRIKRLMFNTLIRPKNKGYITMMIHTYLEGFGLPITNEM